MKPHNTDAVEIEDKGKEASISISFKEVDRLGRENSDTIRFFCPFGGKFEFPQELEKLTCVVQAVQWAKYRRLEGYEVHAWDSTGNCY